MMIRKRRCFMKTGLLYFAMIFTYCGAIGASETQAELSSFLPNAKHNSMAIDPKLRASDYKEVFDCLRKEKAQNKVYVKLADGSMVTNIIDMSAMGNSTVFLLKYNTPRGIKIQAIELELIHGIGYIE